MMFALGVLGILILGFALCWYLVRRSSRAGPMGLMDVPRETQPAATAAAAENFEAHLLGEVEKTESFREEDGRQTGKLSLLGDLAAGIAHEINTPIAIMVEEAGWIEDLLEEEEFQESENLEEFKRALKQIKTQGARCKAIIHNLLSFGRKTSIKVEEVKVNDLVIEVVKAYAMKVRSGNMRIATHFTEPLPNCQLSPSEMLQVLTNLINNAIDALAPEGGKIDITTRLVGEQVVIDVTDNGHGIPEAHLDKIFDPFFTTKPVGKGTGLGLSICYGLVEKTGGEISVDSEVGAGTTFHVRIPWRRQEEQPKSPFEPAKGASPDQEPPPEAAALVPSPTVVLVVDDEVPFVEALQRRLAKRNLQVLAAFSGEQALRELQQRRDIDIVVLDVKMPGMDGIETLREIKASRPLVEVILLSAHTTVESAIEGIKLGAFDYLLKPCDIGQLADQIEKARRRKHRQEQKIMEARIKEITSRRI
jgi:signal transduction histidine kinase/FixJ family two-component response regulator